MLTIQDDACKAPDATTQAAPRLAKLAREEQQR